MPQSAKALKLVGDVHASSTTGREKVRCLKHLPAFHGKLVIFSL